MKVLIGIAVCLLLVGVFFMWAEMSGRQNKKLPHTPPPPKGKHWAEIGEEVQHGDIAVSIQSATVGHVPLYLDEPFMMRSEDPLLMITVRITNSSATKEIKYTTWAADLIDFYGGNKARLKDEYETFYKHAYFGRAPIGRIETASIGPGETVADLLVFDAPIETAQIGYLALPAGAFEGMEEGVFRLKVDLNRNSQTTIEGDPAINRAPPMNTQVEDPR